MKKTTCFDLIKERFEHGTICPYSHCDYKGNPAERKYFCLRWAALLRTDMGYMYHLIGEKYCSKEDYKNCPLSK